jgi:hypothetical protein
MNEELRNLLSRATGSIPEVGRLIFNIGRNASYAAAKRGDIPTMEFGHIRKVPIPEIRKRLGLEKLLA